ncbi:MAG: hypothetical protein K2G76_03615 [Prevotella sp.]|nr:hypothetical protein [Prevotella sp.]
MLCAEAMRTLSGAHSHHARTAFAACAEGVPVMRGGRAHRVRSQSAHSKGAFGTVSRAGLQKMKC